MSEPTICVKCKWSRDYDDIAILLCVSLRTPYYDCEKSNPDKECEQFAEKGDCDAK